MLDAFNCTPSVLRAAYDITDGDLEKWVMMMQERFVSLCIYVSAIFSLPVKVNFERVEDVIVLYEWLFF